MMEAVFIKVLNMSISAGWLILAVMLLRLLLKKAPKWISVVLWGLVGLRLVFPFSLQSVLSLIPSAEVISPSIGYAQHPEINSGVSVIDNAVNPTLGTSLAATPMNSVNPMQIVLYLGGLVWVGGIVILLLYGLISYLRLRRKVTEAIPYEKNTWLCDQVKTPFILGVFRPRIYLPSGLNEKETAYVLAHERSHLKRKDHLWKPLGFLLLTVYCFNPLVWVAYILLCRDIEAACDEKVISDMAMAEKKAYANALVSCSMQRRLILACPLAFGEVGVKERVKGVLNYRKPAFWIIVAALIACAVIAVCFLTNPKDDGPDLSFLNYKNAITLIGQNDTAPYANLYPADSDGVQPGVADSKALAQFLESAEWTKRRAPSSSPEPRGYLEFVIEDDYRIIVYQSERLAAVRFGNDIRYYRTGAGDYEAALATFIPAPSTEPDRRPEQTFDTELILSDPLSFLLSFSNAEIVTLIDNTGRSYEKSGKSFHEIISSQTWTAQAIQGFTTVEPSRQIYLRGDDYWCLSFEQTAPDSEMNCYAHNLLSSQSMVVSFDCGKNLMDELMAWATYEAGKPVETGLTADDEIRIEQMFSELDEANQNSGSVPLSLTRWADQDPGGVVRLCELIGQYAETHRLDCGQIEKLLPLIHDLDGANAEAFAALLSKLHRLYPAPFDIALARYEDQSGDNRPNDLLSFAESGFSLDQELVVLNQIYVDLASVVHLQWGEQYEQIAPRVADMQLHFFSSELPDSVVWIVDGASPVWAVIVPLERGAAAVYFAENGVPVALWQGENERPKLSVTSGNITVDPYPILHSGETIVLALEEHADEIPTLRMAGELRVRMPENTITLVFYLLDGKTGEQLKSETLYNETRQQSSIVSDISLLDGLAPGKYLCYFYFVQACIVNEGEGLFDRLGDDCYFWLEIPER
ncbi:MAG: hypothetical protein IKH34_07865 [Oscillospiraceae bacterium]|nr:hypothetical protein [Oscillospiraceae bacterium]MBR3474964.1 hypothetical protein [Oscillospiraceae bacterium]